MAILLRTLTVVLGLTCASCGPKTSMTLVPPPSAWAQELTSDRASRDVAFRTDPGSPVPEAARSAYRGNEYYAPDPSWRYAGFVRRAPQPEKLTLITTNGKPRPCERVGTITFPREGRVLSLQVYRLLDMAGRPGGEGLFLPFKDATTGKETYAAGRYVDLEGPDGGPFTLDFNRAYNPSCAYGDPTRFQCPVTPKENTLPIAVTAGERGYAAHVSSPSSEP